MTVTMVGGASVSRSAYVPGFDEDLFISYGHLDNARGGWINALHEQLEARLNELLGTTDVRIWRDRRLDGADAFEDVLRQKVSKSALLLSVLSPRYVTSASCTKEVDWFVEAARTQGGIRVDTKARLIRVLKTPLQGAPEPPSLREVDTLGFRFYEERGDDFTEFSADPALPGHAEFQQQCEKLAKAINHLLRRMREARRLVERVERPKVIFLAETTKDLKQARESVRQELSDRGHRVLPETTLPTDDRIELEQALQAIVPECDVAVHMLGAAYGIVPEHEETRSVVHLQYAWVRERRSSGDFLQLVWIPEDLAGPEPKQEAFLKRLGAEPPNGVKTELFKTGLASFKEGLLDILAKQARTSEGSQSRSKSIYLLCDQRDLAESQFQEIRQYLLNEGYPIDLPAFEGDPGELREAERTSVTENDATLIYYGNAKDLWIKHKRQALIAALAQAGKQSERALFLGGPDSDLKKAVYAVPGGRLRERAGIPPLIVLGDCGPFKSEVLRPLLQKLETAT
jgi:hypothetical protein